MVLLHRRWPSVVERWFFFFFQGGSLFGTVRSMTLAVKILNNFLFCVIFVCVVKAEFSFVVLGDWGSGGGNDKSFATTQKVLCLKLLPSMVPGTKC